MIELKDWMTAVGHRITDGCQYGWACYGPHARVMDSESLMSRNTCTVVFDTVTQVVYELNACDEDAGRVYRLIHPNYRDAYHQEAQSRGVDEYDIKCIDLETVQDMLEKTTAIINNRPYDERIVVPLELPDDVLLVLFKMAHEQDITMNQLVIQILLGAVEQG